MCQIVGLLTQNDFFTAAEDFDLLAVKAKLLGQANGLAVAGAEYARGSHNRSPCHVYTASIYAIEGTASRQVWRWYSGMTAWNLPVRFALGVEDQLSNLRTQARVGTKDCVRLGRG